MSEEPEVEKRGVGRPAAKIDWDLVDKLLEADLLGTEIASHLGVAAITLYRHCEEEKKVNFDAYRREKVAKGDGKIKIAQYALALEKDRGMLIWLGKNRLKQKDVWSSDVVPNDTALDKLTDEIKSHKTNTPQIINIETKV